MSTTTVRFGSAYSRCRTNLRLRGDHGNHSGTQHLHKTGSMTLVSSPGVSSGQSQDANSYGKDDPYPRWQEHARGQLEFVNNLLIGLSAGLIAIALNATSDPAKVANVPAWQREVSGVAVIVVGLSALAGVVLAANRLQSTRLTARLVRIRDQLDEVFPPDGTSGTVWQRERLKRNIKGLEAFEHWSRPGIRRAARNCVEPSATFSHSTVADVAEQLRSWTLRADKRNWLLIRVQLSLFIIGAVLFSLAPVWNLFHGT